MEMIKNAQNMMELSAAAFEMGYDRHDFDYIVNTIIYEAAFIPESTKETRITMTAADLIKDKVMPDSDEETNQVVGIAQKVKQLYLQNK